MVLVAVSCSYLMLIFFAANVPGIDYGFPGCNTWIGYETRSERANDGRATSGLAFDLTFPCNGTLQNITARTSAPVNYEFYIARHLRVPPQGSRDEVYLRLQSSAIPVMFSGAGEQTVAVANFSFSEGDTIVFRKVNGPGNMRRSEYSIKSFCLSLNDVISQQYVYTDGTNVSRFTGADCRSTHQYALRIDFIANLPGESAVQSVLSE